MDFHTHSEKVKKFHDQESDRYAELRYNEDSCEGLAYTTRKKLILDMMGLEFGKVLDVGCGPGILTKDLLERKFDVYSMDLSFKMLMKARAENNFNSNAHFIVGNASDICFADYKFDSILCIGVMYYIPEYEKVLEEIIRVLRPRGSIIIQINKVKWPSIYSRLIPIYQYLKTILTSKTYSNITFKFNVFSDKQFELDMEQLGLCIESKYYYDFRVPFIDLLFPKWSLTLGKWMFKYRGSWWTTVFANGILFKATKR